MELLQTFGSHIEKNQLKNYVIKTIFFQRQNKYFEVRYKIPYERGKKSPHIDEPAYFTGPAHLVWTVPYILRNFHN